MRATAVLAFLVGVTIALTPIVGHAAGLGLTAKGLTPYHTCVVTGTPSGTGAVIDATVRQQTPNNNYGTATMHVRSKSGTNRRIYVKFDLTGCSPSIPSSATVKLATMRLYVSGLPPVCRSLDIFRVTAAWTEGGITWNTQPFGTATNNPPSASRTDAFEVGRPVGCANRVAGYVTGADVTTDVAAYVAGSATNHGWMIRDESENSGTTRTVTFSSKNQGAASRAPQLIVTWVR